MKTRILLSALALVTLPALAQAGGEIVIPAPSPPGPVPVAPAPAPAPAPVVESEGGPYGAVYGGASWLEDAHVDSDVLGEDGESDFDTGWIAGGALGYAFGGETVEPRAELDFSYRTHDIDEFQLGGSSSDPGGDLSTISGLANVWVDVPVTERLKPYAGGGLGAAHVTLDTDDVDDGDTVFAWQLGAGVAYQFTPRVAATADYRWFNTEDPSFQDDGETEVDYGTHNALLGLRFLF